MPQSIVQHISGNFHAGMQLSDTAKAKRDGPQDEFATDTHRPTGYQDRDGQNLAETPQVWAKMPSIQENLGAVRSRQPSQFTLVGGTHSVTKEVPLIAHSRPSSKLASSPLLEDTLNRI